MTLSRCRPIMFRSCMELLFSALKTLRFHFRRAMSNISDCRIVFLKVSFLIRRPLFDTTSRNISKTDLGCLHAVQFAKLRIRWSCIPHDCNQVKVSWSRRHHLSIDICPFPWLWRMCGGRQFGRQPVSWSGSRLSGRAVEWWVGQVKLEHLCFVHW